MSKRKEIFVVDKMGQGKIGKAQISNKVLGNGIFPVRVKGKEIIAQTSDFSDPTKGAQATHIAFEARPEAAEYKKQMRV